MSLRNEIHIGNVSCSVNEGDLTERNADTVLVPEPQTHTGVGGVHEAVRSAGAGSACESLDLFHEININDTWLGACLTFPSGGGATPNVSFVASVPMLAKGKQVNFAAVVLSVESVLEDMAKKGLQSVNVPLMGTGQMGWLNAEQSARAMLIGVERFASKRPDAKLAVHFYVQKPEQMEIFAGVMDNKDAYTAIGDQAILREGGKVTPAVSERIEPHRPENMLARVLESHTPNRLYARWGR